MDIWLSKDERRLLAFYFRRIRRVDEPEVFKVFTDDKNFNDDLKALGWRECKDKDQDYYQKYTDRARNVEEIPNKRGLIEVDEKDLGKKVYH